MHSHQEGNIDTDFSDIRKLQIMTDKLRRIVHILQLNSNICRQLYAFHKRVSLASPPEVAVSANSYSETVNNCIFELDTQAARARTLVDRAEGMGRLVIHLSYADCTSISWLMTKPQQIGDMLNMRTAQTAHDMNMAMHELSKQNAEENKLVRMLASQSTRDTRSMKVVALISSIFLPATFVAVRD
jgi:hypothetical protein